MKDPQTRGKRFSASIGAPRGIKEIKPEKEEKVLFPVARTSRTPGGRKKKKSCRRILRIRAFSLQAEGEVVYSLMCRYSTHTNADGPTQ